MMDPEGSWLQVPLQQREGRDGTDSDGIRVGQEDGRSRREPRRVGHNGYSDQECWARERGRDADCRPDRCVRVPGRFLATVTVPVQDPRGMGAM